MSQLEPIPQQPVPSTPSPYRVADLDAAEAPVPHHHGRPTSTKGIHQSKLKRFVVWYFSCLCPPSNNIAGADKEDLEKGEGGGALAAKPLQEHNWLMRILIKECWTDGSLIALKVDVFAGVTLAVAQVAPSVAFALMGHAPPLVGLYSSFFLGIICCIFGGRPGQVTAIAGAVVVLYPDLVDKHGVGAAYAVSVIAGCFLLLPGLLRFARLVRLLPSALMLGFCNGLGISMVMNQIPQFKKPDGDYVTGLQAFYTAIICVVTYAVMMLLPYFTTIVPSAFVAIVIGTAIEYIFQMGTITIGDLYQLHGAFPKPMVPDMDWSDSSAVSQMMVAAVLTAIVSAVESFMSGYKIQQMTETPTNFERESLALGAAHIVNGFFQGMSGCVVYGPCILNIECGAGRRRLSSFICAVLMMVIPLALYSAISIIPMGALSAVLFGVSSKTADWRMLAMIFLQRISFQESVVAIVVTVVTVLTDLAIGAAAGLAAALVFFMWNMSRGRVSMVPVENSAPYSMAPSHVFPPAAAQVSENPPQDCHGAEEVEMSPRGGPENAGESCFADGDGCPPPLAAAEVSATTTVPVSSDAPTPMVNRSFMGSPYSVEVNLLDIQRDEIFPEIKVLRIKLRGVLFFGSCMEFVDGMLKMLHTHHSQIFLRVSDFILDFQGGTMPVMDYSAAEAIQDVAKILSKRSIRTHVQNMDPLSWTCFDRVRRYFPDVCEDDVNNAKKVMYVRRIFKIASSHHLVGGQGRNNDEDNLAEDVFLRGNRSFMQNPAPITAEPSQGGEERVTSTASPREGDEPVGDEEGGGSVVNNASVVNPALPILQSVEEQVPFYESVKIGVPVYRPAFGITVPVFDTIPSWAARTEGDIARGVVPAMELGVTGATPIDRQFCEFSKVWMRRLFNRDVPPSRDSNTPVSPPPPASEPRAVEGPLRRQVPEELVQLPRFPGQGYGHGEKLKRNEWTDVRRAVYSKIFSKEMPPEPNRFVARMKKFEVDLVDGFI